MRLIIEIDKEKNTRTITTVPDANPAIVCNSLKRMADQIMVVSEIYSGVEYDSVYFADFTYLEHQES